MSVSGQRRAQEPAIDPENRSVMTGGVEFEQAWAELRPRLYRMLTGRGAAPDVAEDVLQEAAIKLFCSWSRVDMAQPMWPFARTVTLNCLIDHFRRVYAVPLAELPDGPSDVDVEGHALARARLTMVAKVMGTLRPTDRATLLEVVEPSGPTAGTSAAKMARMRARRRLTIAMEKAASAFGSIPLGWRRVQVWVQSPGVAEAHGTVSSLVAAVVAMTIVFAPTDPTPARPDTHAENVERRSVRELHAISLTRDMRPRGRATEPRQTEVRQRVTAMRAGPREGSPYEDPADPVHLGPARADTDEGRGYKEVYVCTGEQSAEKEDDQGFSVTIYHDGSQREDDPEPESCQ